MLFNFLAFLLFSFYLQPIFSWGSLSCISCFSFLGLSLRFPSLFTFFYVSSTSSSSWPTRFLSSPACLFSLLHLHSSAVSLLLPFLASRCTDVLHNLKVSPSACPWFSKRSNTLTFCLHSICNENRGSRKPRSKHYSLYASSWNCVHALRR
jgi:hypothetical protein